MKTRNDFVTNSSSSSFIIAKHKDCKYEEILEAVKELKDNVKKILNEYGEYTEYDNPDIKCELEKGNLEKATTLAIEDIAEGLFSFNDESLLLGEWYVNSEEFSSESRELFESVIYNLGYKIECDHLKIK